jgi:hypothetical protein
VISRNDTDRKVVVDPLASDLQGACEIFRASSIPVQLAIVRQVSHDQDAIDITIFDDFINPAEDRL